MIILEILRNFFQEFENLFICKEFINCVGLGLGVWVWGWVGFFRKKIILHFMLEKKIYDVMLRDRVRKKKLWILIITTIIKKLFFLCFSVFIIWILGRVTSGQGISRYPNNLKEVFPK